MRNAKGKGAERVNEASNPVDDRKVGKRKAAGADVKAIKRKAKKEKKAKKDPNKPKRPASAFFVFLEEFRKTFKKDNPDVKAVSAVGRAAGEMWKSMTPDEKAPYQAKADANKEKYVSLMDDYTKKQKTPHDGEDEQPARSKPRVVDEDDEDGEDEEDEDGGGGNEEDEEDEEEEEDDD